MPANLDGYFLCSWGDIQLFARSIEWDAGNTLVQHELASGDDHPVEFRGGRARHGRLSLMFDDFEGQQESSVDAFRRFDRSVKERRIFTHPIDGSFFARIGDFTPSEDENSVLTASCVIVPDAPVVPVSPAGAGTTGVSGELAVAAAANQVARSLSDAKIGFPPESLSKFDFSLSIDANISVAFNVSVNASVAFSASASASASVFASASATATASASAQAAASASALAFATVQAQALAFAEVSGVAEASGMAGASVFAFAYAAAAMDADVRASVASWQDEEDTPIRKVSIDTARLSESIATMIDVGRFMESVELTAAFRSAIMLGDAVRSSGVAAIAEAPSIFVMRIEARTALLPLCAKIYGGYDAQSRARQISTLNDIATPGWIDPGDYLMPARTIDSPVFGAA